ncbi:uncharacterized protein FA14DRAFT_158099 [Meira miltonrushii]|uniref:Uncharacterized protein n=1 Tax=Meira miltonrushii TaxID=1280837 RepID=A0A316V3P0_9BASI|nr:uncharacterized protein FA14DRAFT_158099 [Meira miltonrushii]PWN32166.1 hypothetical protein FA14DRAFT_158099 [Meira miltonrushii]
MILLSLTREKLIDIALVVYKYRFYLAAGFQDFPFTIKSERMFHLTSQQQTRRLRTVVSTALTIDEALFMSASVLSWIAYKTSIDDTLPNDVIINSWPSQEIALACASMSTVGMITLPILIHRSWSKTRSSEHVRRSRGTPLTRSWTLPGWLFSLTSLVIIVGVAYHSQHVFASSLVRPSVACTLTAIVLAFVVMTWSIMNPYSIRSTNNLDPRLQVDWYHQRSTSNKDVRQAYPFAAQMPKRNRGFVKRFLSSPQEQKYKYQIRPKYHANIFSPVSYNNPSGQQYELTSELNSISPFDQRSLHRTPSQSSTAQNEGVIRHQNSFSSIHSKQIKRKQIKESDYPLDEQLIISQSNRSFDDIQYFDARSIVYSIHTPPLAAAESESASLHSLSPNSSSCNLATPKDSSVLQEARIVHDQQKIQQPPTWIIPVPPPAFSPKVFPRKTYLLHNRNVQV